MEEKEDSKSAGVLALCLLLACLADLLSNIQSPIGNVGQDHAAINPQDLKFCSF